VLDLPGVAGGATQGQSSAEQERPYLAAESGKDHAYKAETGLKFIGSQKGVREARTTEEGVQDNALEGRGVALVMLTRR
jgi:hypothetical protein